MSDFSKKSDEEQLQELVRKSMAVKVHRSVYDLISKADKAFFDKLCAGRDGWQMYRKDNDDWFYFNNESQNAETDLVMLHLLLHTRVLEIQDPSISEKISISNLIECHGWPPGHEPK